MVVQAENRTDISIQSELVVFPSRSGRRIVGFIDSVEGDLGSAGWVVLTPKFGESKKNSLQTAYQLAANGLRVLRFDHANHVGESAGEIVDYTFSGAIADMRGALDYLERQRDVREGVVLVANSLSGRCALRVAAEDDRVRRLALVVGVVNFQHTATEVYQCDMVQEYRAGRLQGVSDILGHQVDVDAFLEDCIRHDLHDLSGSIADVMAADCEICFFCAGRDAWVRLSELQQLRDVSARVSLYEIPGAMHELRENPQAVQQANLALVYLCCRGVLPEGDDCVVNVPSKRSVMAQNRIERERLRAATPLRESEGAFWKAYLGKYNVLESVGDYQEYLELIGQCLGPVQGGQVYFDCGCGNGMFGAWCLGDVLKSAQSAGDVMEEAPTYFALDLTARGLSDAMRKHVESGRRDVSQLGSMHMFYYRYDLDELDPESGQRFRLPFQDATVDRVCCSLLISYLKRPEVLLGELYRVLKPGGRIVVSSMKPYCDLSVIYKDVVDEAESEATLQAARNLLSAAGAIKLKEEAGHYRFYEVDELESLVAGVGFCRSQGYRSFGDQANLVCAER